MLCVNNKLFFVVVELWYAVYDFFRFINNIYGIESKFCFDFVVLFVYAHGLDRKSSFTSWVMCGERIIKISQRLLSPQTDCNGQDSVFIAFRFLAFKQISQTALN